MNKVYLDFETRSQADLKKVGAWNYAAHPSTEIILAGWIAVNGVAVNDLTMDDLIGNATSIAVNDALIVCHNVLFEYSIWYHILHKKYGVPMPPISRFRCTRAKVLTHGLPAGLGAAAIALDLDHNKDKVGAKLMQKMCKPKRDGSYHDNMEDRQRLAEYCQQDNVVAKAIDERLDDITPSELMIFCIDLFMNTQGLRIDVELAKIAQEIAEDFKVAANARCKVLTDGWVDKLTQVSALKDYCKHEIGLNLDSFDKPTLMKLLANPKTDKRVVELCKLRQAVGKTSVSKYVTALNLADSDGLLRGYLQYHGAMTGRWGGRGLQPQNLPRTPVDNMIEYIDDIKYEYYVGRRDTQIMKKLSEGLRGLIIPREGNRFLIADYCAIEARFLMWFVGEEETVEGFRHGTDLYVGMAEEIFEVTGLTKKKNPYERNVGKETILGCGFGMGVHKFNTICDTKGIDLGEKTQKDFNGNPVSPLAQKCIDSYRNRYLKVKDLWKDLDDAFRYTLQHGAAHIRGLKFRLENDFLTIELLSGRKLYYFKPHLKPHEKFSKASICYESVGKTGMLDAVTTHGGTLTANVISAMSRDIMTHALVKLYKQNYNPVLTVHDEIVCEIPIDDERDVEEMMVTMIEVPSWAEGCPIDAEGMESERYCK